MNKFYLGDCLVALKSIKDETIDLIYLDPPFFTKKKLNLKSNVFINARVGFDDKWNNKDYYIEWLYERVKEMYRVLKKTGILFLHCDYNADAYIRMHILDKIFHLDLVSNILWKRVVIMLVSG